MARGDGWDDEPLAAREQQLAMPTRRTIPVIVPSVCGAGVTPCGKPAHLYPCGWRCDDCKPMPRRRDATA